MICEQDFWKRQPAGFRRVIDDIWCSIQPSTTEKYCYALRNFCQFSLLNDSNVMLPVNAIETSKFLVFLRERGYSKFSIKLGLVSLKWLNSFFPGAPRLNDPFLGRIISSANRNCISMKNQKDPLSTEMIRKILSQNPNPTLMQLRNAVIPAISFSLLLRNDELRHLCCSHIEKKPEGFVFNIVSSKTDVFRKGKCLYLAHQDADLSVSKLFEKYLSAAKLELGSNNFLFGAVMEGPDSSYIDGKTQISYQECLSIFRMYIHQQNLDPLVFGTHSARSGGATLLATKVTPFELMLLGRWRDARSLRNYVEVPESRRFDISRNLFL